MSTLTANSSNGTNGGNKGPQDSQEKTPTTIQKPLDDEEKKFCEKFLLHLKNGNEAIGFGLRAKFNNLLPEHRKKIIKYFSDAKHTPLLKKFLLDDVKSDQIQNGWLEKINSYIQAKENPKTETLRDDNSSVVVSDELMPDENQSVIKDGARDANTQASPNSGAGNTSESKVTEDNQQQKMVTQENSNASASETLSADIMVNKSEDQKKEVVDNEEGKTSGLLGKLLDLILPCLTNNFAIYFLALKENEEAVARLIAERTKEYKAVALEKIFASLGITEQKQKDYLWHCAINTVYNNAFSLNLSQPHGNNPQEKIFIDVIVNNYRQQMFGYNSTTSEREILSKMESSKNQTLGNTAAELARRLKSTNGEANDVVVSLMPYILQRIKNMVL